MSRILTHLLRLGLCGLLALLWLPARADSLVVVLNAEIPIEKLSREEVINIFLGRYRKLPDGQSAYPVDTAPLKEEFYTRLVNKTPAEINAYWARLIFAGGTRPPQLSLDEPATRKLLAAKAGAIAYLPRSSVTRQQRIVLELSP